MRWTISRQSSCAITWLFWYTLSLSIALGDPPPEALGVFDDHSDIGKVLHPGSAALDKSTGSYTVTASGDNIDASTDAFHFLWKKVSSDISLTATVTFPTNTGNSDKEAALMIRQTLDADSPYVAAIWGVTGLKSMRSRREKAGVTQHIAIDGEGSSLIRLEKRGAHFFIQVARKGEKLHPAGPTLQLELAEPFYIGLGVCARDKDAVESAVFSKVTLAKPSQKNLKLYSTLETISVSSTNRHVIAVLPGRITNPTFTLDGKALLFEQGKKLEQISVLGGGTSPATDSGVANTWKPANKPSPDQQHQAILSYWGTQPEDATLSVQTPGGGSARALANIVGGKGTLSNAPWSPDSKLLVFVSYQRVSQE